MEFYDSSHHEQMPNPVLDELDKRISHLQFIKRFVDSRLDQVILARTLYVEGDLTYADMAEVLKNG